MIRQIATAFILGALITPVAACTEKKEPEPEVQKSVRERAEAVGKLGDRTMTNDLEKSLTGIVDAAEERNEMFKDQPEE